MYSIICLAREILLHDFNPMLFPVNLVVYDKLGNGCTVDFPVCLESRLKWTPTVYDKLSNRTVIVTSYSVKYLLL